MALIGIDVRKIGDFGIGTYIRNLIGGLAAEGGGHDYLLLRSRGTDPRTLPPGMESRVERAGLYSPMEPFKLGRSARVAGLDLLHCPHYVTPFMAGCPLAVTIHDLIHLLFPEYLPGAAARQYASYFLRRAAKRASVIFTVSEWTKADILEHLPAREDNIVVTHNAVDPAMARTPTEEEKESARGRYSLEEPFVLYVGNLKPHKNLATAVEAFARFRRAAGPEWRFVIAGCDAPDAELGGTIDAAGISDALRFIGFVQWDNLPALYALARIFLFPSIYEGFGLPPLEAMAAGTPVVAANSSSLPEVLGDAALLTDPLDSQSMAEAMEKIESEAGLRDELVKRGHERVGRFSWEETCRRTLAGYESALGRAGA